MITVKIAVFIVSADLVLCLRCSKLNHISELFMRNLFSSFYVLKLKNNLKLVLNSVYFFDGYSEQRDGKWGEEGEGLY